MHISFREARRSAVILCSLVLQLVIAGATVAAEPPVAKSSIAKSPATQAQSAESIRRGPWDIAALSRAPAATWLDRTGAARAVLYQGEPYHGKPTRVFAYYASPTTLAAGKTSATAAGEPAVAGKKYPGIVLVHGGGGHAYAEWALMWARRGYAAIAIDLTGCGKNYKRLPDGGPDQTDNYIFGAIDEPVTDQWPYHAVADVILAHSLLRSLPEVDAERTAVTGISWGGYLTCIVAGLDPRFKAAVPVYGCGFLHENSYWLPRLRAMQPAERAKWVRLWDPSSHIGGATMPMLFVNGTNDFAYYLDSYAKTYSLARGPRNYRITVNMKHGHQQGWAPIEIGLFVDQYLKGGKPLPVVSRPRVEGDRLAASVKAETALKSATLHYTTDDGPFPKRRWTARPLTLDGEEIRGAAPPARARTWFVTVADDRGATVTSEVMFGK